MQLSASHTPLAELFGPRAGAARLVKQAVLVVLGITLLAVAAKIKVPIPNTPVPMTLGTFAVLTIGAAYGARLGLVTILGYMIIGALGFDVFASSSAEKNGLTYMMGGTGGYLVGYVLATLTLGALAERGWDRSVIWMAVAMLIGNAMIYVPGVLWLSHLYEWGLATSFEKGMTPFLVGDAIKLLLAAVLLPLVWKLIGDARA
ncbi:MAG: biotin transporter BioY [Pseudomonadota bacterium]